MQGHTEKYKPIGLEIFHWCALYHPCIAEVSATIFAAEKGVKATGKGTGIATADDTAEKQTRSAINRRLGVNKKQETPARYLLRFLVGVFFRFGCTVAGSWRLRRRLHGACGI